MMVREETRSFLRGEQIERVVIDVGTSSVTGLRAGSRPDPSDDMKYTDPVLHLACLDEDSLVALGSDLLRCGAVFRGASIDDDDEFRDLFGVTWIWCDGEPAALRHPMAGASQREILHHRRPPAPAVRYPVRTGERALPVICDAPVPGLLEMCFRMRGYWEFLDDIAERWPVANALLDWAMETIIEQYDAVLANLPVQPDLVLYGDDLGYQNDLYLSEESFRFFVRPRLTRILSRIRALTSAEIVFHSCGAVAPLLRDLNELGVRIFNVEPTAMGMDLATLRRRLSPNVILHGVVDFVALARAVRLRNMAELEKMADNLTIGWPMIVAPSDSLPASMTSEEIADVTGFLQRVDLDWLLAARREERGEVLLRALGGS